MMNPAIGQGREALQAPHVQAYIQAGVDSGAYHAPVAGRVRLLAQATGALLSLAVVCSGAWWGYKQIMRDLHGVPVVKALEGPMRIAPDNPGGMVADHAGFAVNAVQAVGTAATPESELILAPEPVALAEEDLATAELTPETEASEPGAPEAEEIDMVARAEADDAELIDPTPRAPTLASLSQDVPEDDPLTRALVLADEATEGAEPLAPVDDAAVGVDVPRDQESAIEAAVRTAAIAVPLSTLNDASGLTASPRPAPRPGRRASTTLVSTEPAAPEVVEPTAIAAGTRLVQLGAFDSQEEARQAWGRIATSFDGLMEDKSQVIVEAEAGGHSFWRLRAMGFDDLAEARRFCAALIAEQAECIPVVAR